MRPPPKPRESGVLWMLRRLEGVLGEHRLEVALDSVLENLVLMARVALHLGARIADRPGPDVLG